MTPKIEALTVDGLTGSSGLSLYARALAPLYGITCQCVNASTGRGAYKIASGLAVQESPHQSRRV